jgi:hypothetical protein
MDSNTLWTVARYLLLLAFGWFAQHGWVNSGDIESIVGAIGVIAVAAWGVFVRKGTVSVPATEENLSGGSVSPATGKILPPA